MRRVMIIGQPGSGKSTLAREIGAIAHLPVFHIDHIHYRPGCVERPSAEKDALCAEVHARETWVFEGGHSSTWPERLARADTLIWLDVGLPLRSWRIVSRTLRHHGRSRPDLPADCPERFDAGFFRFVWRTRRTSRERIRVFHEAAPRHKTSVRLVGARAARRYLDGLRHAAKSGNLGISHR